MIYDLRLATFDLTIDNPIPHFHSMISVSDAKRMIYGRTPSMASERLPLAEALGRVLSASLYSPVDMPPFAQSAMDGYAIRFSEAGLPLKVVGEAPAGVAPPVLDKPGTALRIFTGAAIPDGADTVVMQEKVRLSDGKLYLEDPDLKSGANVRPRASQTALGALVLPAGAQLSPAAIGLLAGLGISEAPVWAKPKVALIVTGRELVVPGMELQTGQIYESNSFTLSAALQELGIRPEQVFRCDDVEEEIVQCLKTALEHCDVVICTGGISVGDYDLVKKAMEPCGVETVFHKVKQKPGKPLFFGVNGEKCVFGLPGNPGSVLTCYYEYVEPLLLRMMGHTGDFPRSTRKILSEPVTKKAGLTLFLKGKMQGDQVIPLHGQESYKMDGFALADCLIVLEESTTVAEKGQSVEVHLVTPI